MEKRIKYYTEEQAQIALDRLNNLMPEGKVYMKNYLIEYNWFYLVLFDGFVDSTLSEKNRVPYVSLFTNDELNRVYDYNSIFTITNNPITDKNFRLGESVFSSEIFLYGCKMSQSEVDMNILSFIENFEKLETADDGYVILHIGGSDDFPNLSNEKPSKEVIDLSIERVAKGGCEIIYWDGNKNVKIPNPKKQIKTNSEYEILSVDNVYRGSVSIPSKENVFFMSSEIFSKFSFLMKGRRYLDSDFKCCVLFDNNLVVKEIFVREEKEDIIYIGDYNLAQSSFDFFRELITSPELESPNLDLWNNFRVIHGIKNGLVLKVFPEIDLTLLS